MDYSLRELECFSAVAEEMSFTRAAQKLRLAQPPLSRHIRTLEERLGVRLFERSSRQVALTPAGSLFYEQTRGILPRLQAAGETTRRFATGETSRLRLGFVSAVLGPELVELLKKFRKQHSGVQLLMQDISPSEQLAALGRGELDGGFAGLRPRENHPGIRYLPWIKEPLAAFIPFGHPLARKKTIALRELAGEAMVAVSNEAAPTFAGHLQKLCAEAGFRPRIVLESPRAQAVAVMVAAGSGIALLPSSLARVLGRAAAVVPLSQVPPLTHVFALRSGTVPVPLRQFVELFSA